MTLCNAGLFKTDFLKSIELIADSAPIKFLITDYNRAELLYNKLFFNREAGAISYTKIFIFMHHKITQEMF